MKQASGILEVEVEESQFSTGAEGNPLQHALQQALDYIQISLHLPKGPCQLFQLLLSVIDDDFLYLYSFLLPTATAVHESMSFLSALFSDPFKREKTAGEKRMG